MLIMTHSDETYYYFESAQKMPVQTTFVLDCMAIARAIDFGSLVSGLGKSPAVAKIVEGHCQQLNDRNRNKSEKYYKL